MEYIPLRSIGDSIEVQFDQEPLIEKKPGCPDGFIWQDQFYQVDAVLREWQDFSRRGRMAHNMRDEHAAAAERRGSWGVGRFYYRVLTDTAQIFELYYDRAPKNVSDRAGSWFLYRELGQPKE
jgi:hypothetical protein